jgi:hypothetical protein
MTKRRQEAAILTGIFSLFTVFLVLAGVWHVAIVSGIGALIALYDFWKGGVLP